MFVLGQATTLISPARRSRARGIFLRAGRGSDHGSVQLLEAFLLAALLIGALTLVNTPPTFQSSTVTREPLVQALGDLLAHFVTAPDTNQRFASLMDRAVAEALQGNSTLFQSRLSRALPPASEFNVYLDNGQGQHKLRFVRTPGGEAVSASRLWSPSWETVLALPAARLVDDARSALRIQAVPVHRALGLTGQAGVWAEVAFELPDGSTVERKAFAALLNRSAEGPTATLSFLDSAGAQVFKVEPADGNDSLFLAVEESQGRSLAAGTPLELRLPPGFKEVAALDEYNSGWNTLSVEGNATYGWTVKAHLDSALSGDKRQFNIAATKPDWGKLHLLEARLDNGTLGLLHGVYVSPAHATRSSALPPGRGPFLTLPSPAPWSASALGGLVVAYPDDIARSLNVTRVSLTLAGGADLLSSSGDAPSTGWTQDGDLLEWTGRRQLDSDRALEWRFHLRADAPADQDSGAAAGLKLGLRNGHEPWAWWQRAPGVFEARIAPRNASAQGFINSTGTHDANLNMTHRGAQLVGDATYETVDLSIVNASAGNLSRGYDESWLTVDTPRAPLGGKATLRWNLTRLEEELVGKPGDAFRCFKDTDGAWQWSDDRADCINNDTGLPWQYVDERPKVSLYVYHPSPSRPAWPVLASATDLAVGGSREVDVPDGAMLGTHAAELRAEFRLEGPSGETRTQRVSLLAAFDVHRPGGVPPAAPLYDVIFQAWLPDWG